MTSLCVSPGSRIWPSRSTNLQSRGRRALGKIGSAATDPVPALIDALADKEEEVLKAAAQGLKRIQGKEIEGMTIVRGISSPPSDLTEFQICPGEGKEGGLSISHPPWPIGSKKRAGHSCYPSVQSKRARRSRAVAIPLVLPKTESGGSATGPHIRASFLRGLVCREKQMS
jgi:hypothetical protein